MTYHKTDKDRDVNTIYLLALCILKHLILLPTAGEVIFVPHHQTINCHSDVLFPGPTRLYHFFLSFGYIDRTFKKSLDPLLDGGAFSSAPPVN